MSSHEKMVSETRYIIFSSYYKHGETNTEIIVGEKKFRERAIEYYRKTHLNERECTHYDIEQFLIHHDATYFDEKDRSVFERVISEYKTNPDKYPEGPYTCNNQEYHPPKIKKDFRFYSIYNFRGGSMYRYTEESAQFYDRFETKKTNEIVEYMIQCGEQRISDQMGWGWCNIVVVTGSNLKVV